MFRVAVGVRPSVASSVRNDALFQIEQREGGCALRRQMCMSRQGNFLGWVWCGGEISENC